MASFLDGSDETNFFETSPTEKNFNSGVGEKRARLSTTHCTQQVIPEEKKRGGGADRWDPWVSGTRGGGGGLAGGPHQAVDQRGGRRTLGSARLQAGLPVMTRAAARAQGRRRWQPAAADGAKAAASAEGDGAAKGGGTSGEGEEKEGEGVLTGDSASVDEDDGGRRGARGARGGSRHREAKAATERRGDGTSDG
uniref:Uncharacterized protein n=2 Tax=Oryza sativa subsp. japonica TaxID=39947 RepID=Q10JC0_ORYSJ|nr:hypothetical protein [Oryza sativa Japonica Group]ABF96716.1 retrotransposon protein, putative, Ty3-gypsy subclass [Oryza sativa Japonica Group]